ncbi:MAG: SDR family oxidoreductase [Thermoanaerobaculia bacterium]
MPSIFFTGFPGFLGSELLPRILRRTGETALCMVQPKFRALAEQRAAELVARDPSFAGRIRLVEGDITRPIDLGQEDIREIYHFAAVYDLAVQPEIAKKVNVDGTRNVVDLASRLPHLERLHYVSTCYVSGRFAGRFMEDDLERGQAFNNHYEATKYEAEVAVRNAMRGGLAATIYRPAIVVGDSTTGATQKYDGPYFVIQWLMRQPHLAMLPVVGNPRLHHLNVVPSDYLIRAMDHLSARTDTIGKTYALADPDPMSVDELIDAIGEATGRRVLRIPMPKSLAKWSLRAVPGLYRLMRIPPEAVDYFVHPTEYDTTNAQRDLGGDGGFHPPSLRQYLPRLIEFVRAHPEIGAAAMV